MNIYDTNALIAVVPNLLRPQKFLLDRFFRGIQMSDTEFVSIDIDVGKRRMSPFVSPLVEGKLVEQRRMQTNTYKPAYIKDKRVPDVRKPIRRMIGERIGGALSGAEREMANIEAEMTDQVDMLDRRLEWMGAQALMNGTVTISGDGFETVVIDYGRDTTLTIVNAGGAKWTAANIAAGTAVPHQDIEAWQRQMLKKSGAVATDLIFTTTSWEMFILDPVVKAAIWYPQGSSAGDVTLLGSRIAKGAVWKGRWGQYELWLYNDWYVNDSNAEVPMVTDGMVLMSGADMMGTRAYGQIIDPSFNYAALPYAPKTWIKQDPGQRLLMMQSSPLVIPARVNAGLSCQTCDPVFTT